MKIRAARPDESNELTRLAIRAKSHWGYAADDLRRWHDDLTITPQSTQRQPTFVIDDGGRSVAVLQLEVDGAVWAIGGLWVAPTAMGKGFGRVLVQHAAAYAAAAGRTQLAIDADPNAEGFYLALGARTIAGVAAPVADDSQRARPQLILDTKAA